MYQKGFFVVLVVAFLVVTIHRLPAQDQRKIDSLTQELNQQGETYDLLWGMAYEIFDSNSEVALGYSRKAFSLAKESGVDSQVVKSGRLTGQLLRRVDRTEEAIKVLLEVKQLAERLGMEGELARILNALAICHTFRAEYDKALEYNFESLVLREKEGRKDRIATALTNIGLTHYKMESYDLALEYYARAKETYLQTGGKVEINLLVNIGLCLNSLQRFKEAEEYFNLAIEQCSPDCDQNYLMQAENGLGSVLLSQNKPAAAERHLQTGYAISITLHDTRFQLESLVSLAKIALRSRNLTAAKAYIDAMDRIKEKEDYKQLLKDYYELQSTYYALQNDYQKASAYLEKVNKLNDSIFAADVIKNLTRVQTQFAQRENLAIIAEKNSILALNEKIISQQRSFNILLAVIVVLSSALVAVVYQNNRKIKAVNAELATAKGIIEDHNKFLDQLVDQKTKELVNSNEALVKVNDELDNFIYKTSHDIRGPLASLKGMVNLAIMDVKDDKALGYLQKLDLTAEKLNMILTRLLIVNRINHAELKPETILFEPIIQEILTLEVKKGIPAKIKIDYEVAPDVHLVSDRDLVRLILENLIDNAVKYYNDSERVGSFVRIKVGMEGGKVTARVVDNGVGISTMNRQRIFQMFVRASERSDTGGIGLYLAKLATEKVGGDISLISTDEKYTEFVVQFPATLPKAAADKRAEEAQRREATLRASLQASNSNQS